MAFWHDLPDPEELPTDEFIEVMAETMTRRIERPFIAWKGNIEGWFWVEYEHSASYFECDYGEWTRIDHFRRPSDQIPKFDGEDTFVFLASKDADADETGEDRFEPNEPEDTGSSEDAESGDAGTASGDAKTVNTTGSEHGEPMSVGVGLDSLVSDDDDDEIGILVDDGDDDDVFDSL